ncbi:hypothetical protein B0H21DRAFT_75659 [Amylocystis lapponica]|nr:hypothetical protein B0H21DRAFT_75659 [Amylocystis lapponica]
MLTSPCKIRMLMRTIRDGTAGCLQKAHIHSSRRCEIISINTNSAQATLMVPSDFALLVFIDATSEWLSFLLMTCMTVGWFTLLASLLGFWCVKLVARQPYHSAKRCHCSASGTTAWLSARSSNSSECRALRTAQSSVRGSAVRRRKEIQMHVLGDVEDEPPISPRGSARKRMQCSDIGDTWIELDILTRIRLFPFLHSYHYDMRGAQPPAPSGYVWPTS